MNPTTQCLRRLGWITALFALAPGVILLAFSTTDGHLRDRVDCGGGEACMEAARLRPAYDRASAVSEETAIAQRTPTLLRRLTAGPNG